MRKSFSRLRSICSDLAFSVAGQRLCAMGHIRAIAWFLGKESISLRHKWVRTPEFTLLEWIALRSLNHGWIQYHGL